MSTTHGLLFQLVGTIKIPGTNYIVYCEIIINRGVLIFVDFVVHLKL